MRSQVIEYLKRQNLGGLALSSDLPFTDSGVSLYLQNARTVYVDAEQATTDPVFQTLGAHQISNEVISTSVYFTVDSKTQFPNYDDVVKTIKSTKDNIALEGVTQRDTAVSTEYEQDLLVTTVDITLTRLQT